VFARAERPEVTSSAVATGRPKPAEPIPRRTGRSPQLVAIVVAALCVSACQSTTVAGLNVRAGPSTSSKIVAKMNSAGSAVYIECYTRGQSIYGQTIWYRISQPHKGYVTAYYVRTDSGAVGPKRAC
jgi:Bacterial SH3 domain